MAHYINDLEIIKFFQWLHRLSFLYTEPMSLKVVDSSRNPSSHDLVPRECVVVLGNIDGFHRGHQELVRQAQILARAHKCPVWIATFNPHPIEILKPQSGFQRLFSLEHQQKLLAQAGVAGIYYFDFDQAMSRVSAQDFLNTYLYPKLNPKAVVVGFNFRFGHGRGGGPDELQKWGREKNIEVVVVPQVQWKNDVISSTQVRKYLLTGQVKAAFEILGFPFFIEGRVEPGAGRGRKLGFPTANISCPPTQIPAFGVYATKLVYEGSELPAVSHLGPLPSFEDALARLETHVIDGVWNFEGKILQVKFIDRIRDVQKFDSIVDLSNQIQKDIKRAREIHHEA